MGKNIKPSSARTDGKGQMGYCLRVALAQSLKVATSLDSEMETVMYAQWEGSTQKQWLKAKKERKTEQFKRVPGFRKLVGLVT